MSPAAPLRGCGSPRPPLPPGRPHGPGALGLPAAPARRLPPASLVATLGARAPSPARLAWEPATLAPAGHAGPRPGPVPGSRGGGLTGAKDGGAARSGMLQANNRHATADLPCRPQFDQSQRTRSSERDPAPPGPSVAGHMAEASPGTSRITADTPALRCGRCRCAPACASVAPRPPVADGPTVAPPDRPLSDLIKRQHCPPPARSAPPESAAPHRANGDRHEGDGAAARARLGEARARSDMGRR